MYRACCVLLCCLLSSASSKQPNILFILSDDMGYQDVGFRGSDILTPNIDALAEEGVVLENHYVLPVCAPTRASFLSGRYAVHTGFWRGNIAPGREWGLNLNERTIAEMLKGYGYSTHMVGKWHVGTHSWAHTPVRRGFDTFMGMFLGSGDYFTHMNPVAEALDCRSDYVDSNGTLVDKMESELDGQYITDVYTRKAIEAIEGHKDKPLFLYLAYTAPHSLWQLPHSDHVFFQHMPNATDHRKTYAGMISAMDRGIGQVVEALDQAGIRDNTLIVFCSDNGDKVDIRRGSNYPLRDGKGSQYEGGVRSVSFVNSPLLPKTHYTNKHLHHIIDWFPTFEALAQDGGAYNGTHDKLGMPIDGVNIWDSITKNVSQRNEVLIGKSDPTKYMKVDYNEEDCIWIGEKHVKQYSVLRHNHWKILAGAAKDQGWSGFRMKEMEDLHNGNNREIIGHQSTVIRSPLDWLNLQLYNLEQDPREENNLASEHPGIVMELLKRLDEYTVGMVVSPSCSSKGNVSGVWYPWIKDKTPTLLL